MKLTGQTSDFLKVVLPACGSGKLKLVREYLDDGRRFVLRKSADIEAMNQREETPLFAAARGGRGDAVAKLIESGASLFHVNLKGQTVLDVAEKSNKIGIERVRDVLRSHMDS